MMLRVFVASAMLAAGAYASYCGESMIPFSFEVLEDGQPVLGCARPTCFGWAPSGAPHSHQTSFYRIRGTADGFERTSDASSIPPFVAGDTRYRTPQAAKCEPGFGSVSCAGVNSWVGGIAPLLNLTAYPTTLRCCVNEELRASEDRGVATVGGGQIVTGGEVLSEDVQYAFDYISDVSKIVSFDQSIQYDVSIRRMPCAPLPGPSHYSGKFVKQQHGDVRFAPRAYQDPIQSVDEPLSANALQPPPPTRISESEFEENGVIEEIVREEGIQLPPGTQFQQVAPPVQQPVAAQQGFFGPQQPAGFVGQAPVQAQAGFFPVAAQNGFLLCFSGDMTVQTPEGEKRMDELKKNDFVLAVTSAGVEHVPVDFWLHRNPDTMAEFRRLVTEDGRVIKLTAHHYIYKGDCSRAGAAAVAVHEMVRAAVYAEEVAVGDCLYTENGGGEMREVRVVRADLVTERGIYAPMTSTGKILVGGVHASCHASVQSHTVQKTYFSAVEELRNAWTAFFGQSESSFVDTPYGLELLKSILDLVAPKELLSL